MTPPILISDDLVYLPLLDEVHRRSCDVTRKQAGCWTTTIGRTGDVTCMDCRLAMGRRP